MAKYGAHKDPYLSSFITHVICDNIYGSNQTEPSAEDAEADSEYTDAKEVFDLTVVKVLY